MSDILSMYSRWVFPAPEYSQFGETLVIRLAGLRRIGLVGSVPVAFLGVLMLAASPKDAVTVPLMAVLLPPLLSFFLFDLLAPPTVIEVDRSAAAIGVARIYFQIFRRTTTYQTSDITGAAIDSEEVRDKRGRPQGRFAFHPMLGLRSGAVVRLTSSRAFEHADAARIVAVINDLLQTNPAVLQQARTLALSTGRPSTVEQINAAVTSRWERRGSRALGIFVICGAVWMLWELAPHTFSRREAAVTGAAPACQYSWRFSKNVSETTWSDCSFVPRPQKAPADMEPRVSRGFDLDVRFPGEDGSAVTGRVFVPNPAADEARRTGTLLVVHRPEHPVAIRLPIPARTLLLPMVLMCLSGVMLFFMSDLRDWLRQRGLVWR